jgi:hypothetical protein
MRVLALGKFVTDFQRSASKNACAGKQDRKQKTLFWQFHPPSMAYSKFAVSGELDDQETKLQQFAQSFSATPLPPDSPRAPGIRHRDQCDAVATDRTGAIGND